MGRLTEAVRTGTNQCVATLGHEGFDYLARNPAEGAIFTQMMQETSELVKAEAVRLVDASSVGTIVDIGGANGALACGFVAANANAKGVVYELPHVVELAAEYARGQGLSDRVSAVAGDFFQSVPAGDLYRLKFILHDWDDASYVKILANCAKSLSPNGRVIVVTLTVGAIGEPGLAPVAEMLMLGLSQGRERTLDEYKQLFEKSGLQLRAVTPTQSPFFLIEAVAA
jgi:predicted O-methyltransferase YrrM